MSVASVQNGTSHAYHVASRPGYAPPWAYVGRAATPDPHRAPPGAVPFADYLRAANETDRSAGAPRRERDRVELSNQTEPSTSPNAGPAVIDATLGEVPKSPAFSPASPPAAARGCEPVRIARVHVAGEAGRIIDVVV